MLQRECGDCSVCCFVGAVPDLNKDTYTKCIYVKEKCKGCCSIFDRRKLPKTCKDYECAWKQGFGPEFDKPNKNHVLFTCNKIENQIYFTAIELKEGAITEYGEQMALNIAMETQIPIIVVKYGTRPPHDKGDWVIITDKTLPRCSRIAGEEIHRFNSEVAMYELIKGK